MANETLARRLWQAGLALFVFGLAFGFVIKALPNPRLALSAHLNAVQSGTFLVALGLLWPRLAVWPRFAAALCTAIRISFWTLEAGMVLAAFSPANGPPDPSVKTAAQALIGLGAVVMMISMAALLAPFGRRRGQEPAIAPSPDAIG